MTQIPDKIFFVDSSFRDNIPHHEFSTLQAAIDQISAYEKVKIILYDNLMGIPTLKLTNERTNITIDGGNVWGIYFKNNQPIFEIGKRQSLKFKNMTYIRGDRFIIDNIGANVDFYNCQSIMCSITLKSGLYSALYINDTKFYGGYNNPAIKINNGDVKVEIFNSYVKGGYNNPAILFESNSIKKFKSKNSVLLHGTNMETPIKVDGDYIPEVYIYGCRSQVRLYDQKITNWLVNDENLINQYITF